MYGFCKDSHIANTLELNSIWTIFDISVSIRHLFDIISRVCSVFVSFCFCLSPSSTEQWWSGNGFVLGKTRHNVLDYIAQTLYMFKAEHCAMMEQYCMFGQNNKRIILRQFFVNFTLKECEHSRSIIVMMVADDINWHDNNARDLVPTGLRMNHWLGYCHMGTHNIT